MVCRPAGIESAQLDRAANGVGSTAAALTRNAVGGRNVAADMFTITARFWSKVDVGKPSECWEWRGGANEAGYGRFKVGGKLVSPHRFAYELKYGRILDNGTYHGTVVRHRCDNPRCTNPAHLVLGDQRANVHDMDAKGRRSKPAAGKYPPELIRKIFNDPRPHRVIAETYGVSKTYVGYIKRGDRGSAITGMEPTGAHR